MIFNRQNAFNLKIVPGALSLFRFIIILFTVSAFLPRDTSGQERPYMHQHFNNENGLPQNSVKEIIIDSPGYAWLWTEAGIVRFDGQRFLLVNTLKDGSPPAGRVGNFHRGKNGLVVVIKDRHYTISERLLLEPYKPSPDEIKEWKADNKALQYEVSKTCMSRSVKGLMPRWAVPDPRRSDLFGQQNFLSTGKRYYYFNESLELVVADTGLKHFQRVYVTGLPPPAKQRWLMSLLKDKGGIYLRWGGYVYRCDFNSEGNQMHARRILYVGDIAQMSSFAVIQGKDLYFAGTLTDGLYLFKNAPFSTKIFRDKNYNNIYAHVPLGDSFVLTPRGILPEIKETRRLEGYLPYVAFRSRDGRFMLNRWISAEHSGVAVFDSSMHELQFIRTPYDNPLTAIFQQSNGEIWVATRRKVLGRMNDTGFVWLPHPPGITDFRVVAIRETDEGELWLGASTGLMKLDPRTGKYSAVQGLTGIFVRALHLDTSGILWIGTNGHGLYALNNGRLIKMPLDKNNFLLNVHSLLEDAQGFAWITTNQGLFQASMNELRKYARQPRQDVYYHLHLRPSGFLTNEFNGGGSPTGIVLADGKFSFPSMNGVVQFYPHMVNALEPDAPIRIDQVKCNNQLIGPPEKSIEIPGNTSRLAIKVSSPYFGYKENQAIRYRLQGLDTSYYDLPQDGEISFSKLPHGKYELLLEKKAGFDKQPVVKRLSVYVRPLFIETIAFKLMIAAAALILIVTAFRIRTHALNVHRKKLEAEVKERTIEQRRLIKELEVTVSDLEASKESLQQKNILQEQLTLMVTHDLQSPLRFLEDVSGTLKKAVNNAQQGPVKELSNDLQQATKKIHRFVREFSLWLKTKGEDFHLQNEPVKLCALLEDSVNFFTDMAGRRNIQITIDCPAELTVWINRQMLTIVLRNLIDNAIKYTPDGTIVISADSSAPLVCIFITDQGNGFSPVALHRVRRLLENSPVVSLSVSDSGYGYRFISDFCRVMKLDVSIVSSGENGTSVRIGGLKPANRAGQAGTKDISNSGNYKT